MVRWPILRTLLYKEALRYRYNWGLLVMVAALLVMSGLISISARMNRLPGQQATAIRTCDIRCADYFGHARARAWAGYLVAHPPPGAVRVSCSFPPPPGGTMRASDVPPNTLVIELVPPGGAANAPDKWAVRYWYPAGAEDVPTLRDWFARESHRFLEAQPAFEEESHPGGAAEDRVPLVITALTIFALYLLSFNLYLTSSGEEREKRVLLGLLLSPASPAEFILAKAIFYVSASLVVSLAVVAMYEPRLLARPLLWAAIMSGSLGYVAIGTVILAIVRRQTTISIVSMLYLIATSTVMFLSQFLPLFTLLRRVLIEDYLYRELQIIIAQKPVWLLELIINQVVLGLLVLCWGIIAIEVFRRQGMAISRGR